MPSQTKKTPGRSRAYGRPDLPQLTEGWIYVHGSCTACRAPSVSALPPSFRGPLPCPLCGATLLTLKS
jgi:hypothetical protein